METSENQLEIGLLLLYTSVTFLNVIEWYGVVREEKSCETRSSRQ